MKWERKAMKSLKEGLRPVGFVSIAIFYEEWRPRNDLNVAMIYAVGPDCGNSREKGGRNTDLSPAQFLLGVRTTGEGIASAIVARNRPQQ